MKNERYLHSFTPVFPRFHLDQNHINDWILKIHDRFHDLKKDNLAPGDSLERFALKDEYIRERFFECGDLTLNWDQHEVYRLMADSPQGKDLFERNTFFGKRVEEIFAEIYENEVPSHLIHVTCTGYVSPSPAQAYFSKKEKKVDITHAYHMGCYASFPAIRMALGIGLNEEKNVDVVHTEMCSLHLDPTLHTPEQMVVQSLFADGHIKYTVGEKNKNGYLIRGIHESLLPDSLDDMTWVPGPFGMMMSLSRKVPFKIRDAISSFVRELCEKSGVSWEEVHQNGVFAIHPGGPKIIEMVQKKLELRDEQVKDSLKVLRERGNMSSATLPHVWKEILDQKTKPGTLVLSLAFGPGLTIFGGILEVGER